MRLCHDLYWYRQVHATPINASINSQTCTLYTHMHACAFKRTALPAYVHSIYMHAAILSYPSLVCSLTKFDTILIIVSTQGYVSEPLYSLFALTALYIYLFIEDTHLHLHITVCVVIRKRRCRGHLSNSSSLLSHLHHHHRFTISPISQALSERSTTKLQVLGSLRSMDYNLHTKIVK